MGAAQAAQLLHLGVPGDIDSRPSKFRKHSASRRAAAGLAHCIVSATAFLDLDAVVVDGAAAPELLQALCESARHALADYNWEGLHQPPRLELGTMGSDARALGGALLPLHACFAPDTDIFLKA